jgi:hypothetical protein
MMSSTCKSVSSNTHVTQQHSCYLSRTVRRLVSVDRVQNRQEKLSDMYKKERLKQAGQGRSHPSRYNAGRC